MAEYSFWNVAQKDPDHLALVTPEGVELRAGELAAASNRIVHGLRSLGLGAGDTFAAVLPNGAEFVALYLAALQGGFYMVPINHHLAAPEIAFIVSDSEAKVFIGHERFAEVCAKAAAEAGFDTTRLFAVGAVSGFRPLGELTSGQPDTAPPDRATGSIMNYTAGTTGRPKGVRRPIPPLDPDTVAEMNAWFLALFAIQPNDGNVHLVVSPLYHTAVLTYASMSLHFGHTIVVMDKWTPSETLRLIERYRVTTSHMVPTQFHRLLQLPSSERAGADVSSLRHMIHSAAPCPIDVKRKMLEWWGPVIDEYYAATEGGGTLVTSEEWVRKPGTVGKPWPISEIRVLDDDGKPCASGEPGTVWIKMGEYSFEYHKDASKTASTWRDGFFTVGDIGYLDDDGYLFLCDRKIDMIISGGVNIYPAEIEAVLFTHPKVGDATVFGIPNDDWGEEVKAVIEPIAGVAPSSALAEEIIAFCAEQLAKYKVPRTIDFIEHMPRDPNGKLAKRTLRDPFWKGRERAI